MIAHTDRVITVDQVLFSASIADLRLTDFRPNAINNSYPDNSISNANELERNMAYGELDSEATTTTTLGYDYVAEPIIPDTSYETISQDHNDDEVPTTVEDEMEISMKKNQSYVRSEEKLNDCDHMTPTDVDEMYINPAATF